MVAAFYGLYMNFNPAGTLRFLLVCTPNPTQITAAKLPENKHCTAMENIIIAYCRDNMEIARTIDEQLSRIGIKFEHLTNMPGSLPGQFTHALQNSNGPVLLIITDNFLRNLNCMVGATETIKRLMRTQRVIPIVADGIRVEPGEAQNEAVPTRFDRVIHAIQYLNHWQNEYLEANAQIENLGENQKQYALDRLSQIRRVSEEIGDLLNQLRDGEYLLWDEFKKNDFQVFFKQFGLLDWHSQFAALNKTTTQLPSAHTESTEQRDIPTPLAIPATEPAQPQVTASVITPETIEAPILPTTPIIEQVLDLPVAKVTSQFISKVPGAAKTEGEAIVEPASETMPQQVAMPPAGSVNPTPKREETETAPQFGSPAFRSPKFPVHLQDIIDDIEQEEHQHLSGMRKAFPDTRNEEYLAQEIVHASAPILQDHAIQEVETKQQSIDLHTESTEVQKPETVRPVVSPTSDYLSHIANEKQRIAVLVQFGERAEAIIEAKKLTEVQPEDDSLRFFYAQTLALHSEQTEEANKQILILQQNGYPTFKILELRGDLALKSLDPLHAKEWWENALTENPESADLHMRMGNVLETYFKGAKKTAAKHYKTAADLLENDPLPCMKYADLMLEYLDKPKKAAKYYLRAAQLSPSSAEAWYGLALSAHHAGDAQLAAQAYHKAIVLNSKLRSATLDRLLTLRTPVKTETLDATPKNNAEAQILTILITGATSGIGKATAKFFAEKGHRVIVTGRREDRLENLQDELQLSDEQMLLAPFDVRNVEDVRAFVKNIPTEWQNIDLLINNAGLAQGLSFIHEGDITEWDTMIDTNIKGLLYMTRAIAPLMVARKKGHIINISSSAGKEVYPKGNVYCATKWAVEALTKGMRLDLHNHGIRVSQVSPGHVEETEFALTRFHGDTEKAQIYNDFQPLKASDVAEAIYFIVTRPDHVNIQDVQMFGKQQASSTVIDRSGR
jgi:NADP-dependent 3-hydroxy acid dehydrogenase YdfG/Flp pilus assembly protein TadD